MNVSRSPSFVLFVIAVTCCSVNTLAHHGVNGQFDVSQEIVLSGVVTDIRFVNPHAYVYLDVTNSQGEVENWSCEMSGASLLRRNGWTAEKFVAGTAIRISGYPARSADFSCGVDEIVLDDSQTVGTDDLLSAPIAEASEFELTLADGTPNFNGNWIAQRQASGQAQRPARAEGERPVRGEGERPQRVDGERPAQAGDRPRQAGGGRGPQFVQTEAGIAASAGFDRMDNPRFHCQTTNIFIDWTFNEQVNNIVQTDNAVILNYGFMEMMTRTIHLDLEEHPAALTPSRTGHSIGYWQGDTLVVDTVGFAEGYLSATFNGVKHSEAMHVIERFWLSDDGKTLTREYVVNDPLYLAQPYQGSDSVVRTSFPFEEYGCEDLTQ